MSKAGIPVRALACAFVFAVPMAVSAQALPAPPPQASSTGELAQAQYRVDFPDGPWNGDLVVLAHGFEPVGAPRPAPMAPNEATPVFLGAGYAVAQSAYASQGWAVREAIVDIERLRQHFQQQYGAARHTYLVGFSMGGGIAVASLEQHPQAYDGALSLCGANVPGPRMAEELFTTLVAFDYYLPDVAGIPGGLANIDATASAQGEVMSAIGAALAGKPEVAALLARHLEVPGEAVPGVISLHYLVFQDLARRAGGMPVDNRASVYRGFGDDNAFNQRVRRYAGDAKAMVYTAGAPALTGRAGKPLVLQYNHGDPTITARFQQVYADLGKRSPAATQALTLAPAGEGHCGFSGEQIAQSFRVLTNWVETGKRPGGK